MSAYVSRGTDSSGRPIRMSPIMAATWARVIEELGFEPVITQGGWMGDLAASLSGTTHNGDACDLRVWNLTPSQVEKTIRVLRSYGYAAWLRNLLHGGFKDAHIHFVPGYWASPSPSALRQWDACKNGRDGLAGNGPDYHAYSLADTPPEDDMTPDDKKQLDRIEAKADRAVDLILKVAEQQKARAAQDKAEHEQTQAEIG